MEVLEVRSEIPNIKNSINYVREITNSRTHAFYLNNKRLFIEQSHTKEILFFYGAIYKEGDLINAN
ncbi:MULTISPECIES: hypothetical protein [Methanobacterium]|uniref:Uncharacterized protein n=1 Tax=Methanobacterium veterum TaxID=408577 RepID=A0A9E4ZW16_9EURY|nr:MULTISPECIES: hypothetical protein [Methanobacterium]MCZ3365387.1 hypothetical protein [Methanobacterium veterum]MCZ3373138.1 hypothetical protein [Methanobacterium veterum]